MSTTTTSSTTNTSCPAPYTQDRDLFLAVPQTVLANGITQLYKNGTIPNEIQGYTVGSPTLEIDTSTDNTINITFPLSKGSNTGNLVLTLALSYIAIEAIVQLFYVNFPGGTSNYVNCNNLGTTFSSSDGFTFEAWVQMSDDGTEQTLFSVDGDTPVTMTAQIANGGTKLSLTWGNKYTWTDLYTNLSDGRWHHVAVIVNNDQISFALDGRPLISPSTFEGTQTANGTLKLGPSFTGNMTQAAVWKMALTGNLTQLTQNPGTQELQQWMNADLSRTTSKPVGYWTFTDLQDSTNIINGQSATFEGTATPQKAPQQNKKDPYAIFLYSFDSTEFVTLEMTDSTFSSIQVTAIKKAVNAQIAPYINSAYLISKGYSDKVNIFPSMVNFITLNASATPSSNQLLLPMMVVHNPSPLDRGFGDAPLALPENMEIEIALWDYTFLKDFVEPKLEEALGVDDSYFKIDNTSDCSAAILSLSKDATSGSTKYTTLTVEIIPTPTNAVSFETKGTALNGLYNFNFQTQVDITLNADTQEILTSPKSTSSSISPTTGGGFAIAGGVIAILGIFGVLSIFAIIIAIVFVILATVGVSAAFNSKVNKTLDQITNTFDIPSVGGLKIEEIAFEDNQNTLDFYGTFNAS